MSAVLDTPTYRLGDLVPAFLIAPLCAIGIFTPFVMALGVGLLDRLVKYGDIEIGWKQFVVLSYLATLLGGTRVLVSARACPSGPSLAEGRSVGTRMGLLLGLVLGILIYFPFAPVAVVIGTVSGMATGMAFVALLPAKRTRLQRRMDPLRRERESRRRAGGLS